MFDNSTGGTVTVSGASNAISSETGFTNAGHITVDAGGQLTLSSDTVTNTNGFITVDAATTGTAALAAGQLTLTGTTVNNGTIDNYGTLDLTGSDLIQTGALDTTGNLNVTGASNAIDSETGFTNAGHITVDAGGQLTLNSDVVDNFSGLTNGLIQVDDGATLTLDATTISGGIVTIEDPIPVGTLILQSGNTIEDGALNIYGRVNVTGTNNTISGENSGATIVTNSGHITVDAGGQLTLIERHRHQHQRHHHGGPPTTAALGAGQLTLSGTTVNSGTLDNGGALTLSGSDTIETACLTTAPAAR